MFDLIVDNADRKGGHVLVEDGDAPVSIRLRAVDHGVTFNVEEKHRTVVWDLAGEPLDAVLVEMLDHLEAADRRHVRSEVAGAALRRRGRADPRARASAAQRRTSTGTSWATRLSVAAAVSRAYRDQGIVLRSHKLGETDRIVTLLLQGRGKVRAVAKGVRRPGSRIGARLRRPFAHVDLELHEGRSLEHRPDEVQRSIETNAHIRARTTASSLRDRLVWPAVDAVSGEGQRDHALFLLLRAGLAALRADPEDPSIFVDAFLLRAASVVGFPVFTSACARCRRAGEHRHLSVIGGGTLCDGCAGEGTRQVGADVIEAVRLLGDDRGVAGAPGLARERPGEARATASSYARAFVEHHLDRRLRAYSSVERDEVGAAQALDLPEADAAVYEEP